MHESIMWNYIAEEKEILNNLVNNNDIKSAVNKYAEIDVLYIVAHGSSYNAASAMAPIISKLCNIRVYVYTPSNFVNNNFSLLYENKNNTLVCGISQTGNSRGVLEAIQYAKAKKINILGITSQHSSLLDHYSDDTLYLHCGNEDSNAKTKGYSATLMTLIMFAITLSEIKGNISNEEKIKILSELKKEINNLPLISEQTIKWCNSHQFGKDINHLYVIGDGVNYSTAMEGMLKLMETVCIPAMFSDIDEFSHGMHRSVKSNSTMILIQDHKHQDEYKKTFDYFRKKGVKVMMISYLENVDDANIINIPSNTFTSSIFLITTIIQILSVFSAEVNGQDPNRDANNDYTDYMSTRI